MARVRWAAGFPVFALAFLLVGVVSVAEQKPARKAITIAGETIELMTGDEVRALGFPWVDVPDDENAATYYIEGANNLYKLGIERNTWLDQRDHAIEHGWDDSMKALADYLDAAKPALDLFRKGASMKLCQLPYEKTEMIASALWGPLDETRNGCRLLTAEARRFEAQGKFEEAIDNYVAVIKVGEHYAACRSLIDYLVGIACVCTDTDAAFQGICRYNYPRDELARFLSQLDALRHGLPDFLYAMNVEKAFGLTCVDDITQAIPSVATTSGPHNIPSPLAVRLFRVVIPDRGMKKDMAAAYDKMIAAARLPYYEPGARPSDEAIVRGMKIWNVIGYMMLPAVSKARMFADQARARFDMLRLAIALDIYKQDHGAYPDALEKLVDAKLLDNLPADPFSGESFKYRVEDGEFVLYSVGENLVDDGGKLESPTDFGQQSNDWGYTSKLPPPEKSQPKGETEGDTGRNER